MMKINKIISEKLRHNNGFTLIEVIAVLVIIAIISAVVVVRGISTADVNLQAEIDTLKGHLRYAQYLALNENDTDNGVNDVKWGIEIVEATSSYTLVKTTDNGTTRTSPFNLPNESSPTHSFAPITATGITILFDKWGSANDTSHTSITIGGKPITDAIKAGTGFIP